jgi:hypothetical protein
MREIWINHKQNTFEDLRRIERNPIENIHTYILGNYCLITLILLYNKVKEKFMSEQGR